MTAGWGPDKKLLQWMDEMDTDWELTELKTLKKPKNAMRTIKKAPMMPTIFIIGLESPMRSFHANRAYSGEDTVITVNSNTRGMRMMHFQSLINQTEIAELFRVTCVTIDNSKTYPPFGSAELISMNPSSLYTSYAD